MALDAHGNLLLGPQPLTREEFDAQVAGGIKRGLGSSPLILSKRRRRNQVLIDRHGLRGDGAQDQVNDRDRCRRQFCRDQVCPGKMLNDQHGNTEHVENNRLAQKKRLRFHTAQLLP